MNFSIEILQKVIAKNNIPSDTKILIDNDGVSRVTHIYYHEEFNVLMLTGLNAEQSVHDAYANIYGFIDLTDYIDSTRTGANFYMLDTHMMCSQCPKLADCPDADREECMRKLYDKEGYYEVQYTDTTGMRHTGLTKWKLLWHHSW